ncbi:DUF1285 domain-containing protein [Salinimonas lutimaris]|uniref:DUF1285 domain-containing protein n=1 Tax=Salinimonas lutimaris TaxID=914153 RepID=UPI0010C04EB3|nr:DUF1285 domain-containing protein [Salinimonas lutimaris]
MDLSNFGQKISDAAGDTSRVLPPVDKWDPPFCGDINLTIKLDGSWHYEGTPIGRRALVRLFSTVVKKEQDSYFLVTPVEKIGITVEDVPFLITQWSQQDDAIVLTTNVGDTLTLSSNHPMQLRQPPPGLEAPDSHPIPYVCVRRNLWARLHQNVYYQLIEQADSRTRGNLQQLFVTSEMEPFIIGELPAE